MVYFKIDKFAGIAPGVNPRNLSDQFGQIAKDIELDSGTIKGSKTVGSTEHTAQSDSQSVYLYEYGDGNQLWLEWPEADISVAKGPIPGDTTNRLYWTGEDYPRIGWAATITGQSAPYPTASYALGVPAPNLAPTVTVTGPENGDFTPSDVSYVYTLVTDDGREGPPSPASGATPMREGQTATLGIPSPNFNDGNHNFGANALKRIYRSNTGSNSTQFQLCKTVPYATVNTTDTKAAYELQELLPSADWIGPPDDDTSLYPDGPLKDLIPLAQGVMAGFTGKRFCLSVPFLPHAWPISYRITTEEDIVTIAGTNNGVIALTESKPYFITGTDPSAMTAVTVDLAQACINKNSVVDMGEYVLYAGPDGLCQVQGASGSVVTTGLISVDQWNSDFNPTTYKAFLYEGKYVAFSGADSWIYDPSGAENTLTSFSSPQIYGAFYNPKAGELFPLYQDSGRKVKEFRGGSERETAVFKSKKFVAASPLSMGWISVEAGEYPVRVKVWADGTLIVNYELTKSTDTYTQVTTTPSGIDDGTLREPIMRMPAVIGQVWEIQVEGKDVFSVCLAQSMSEVQIT